MKRITVIASKVRSNPSAESLQKMDCRVALLLAMTL